jgi:hypothetical protein
VEELAMPIHDWSRLDAGICHGFHHGWIEEIKRALNRGLLPQDYYALVERLAGEVGPNLPTFIVPSDGASPSGDLRGVISVASTPPPVRFRARTEIDLYATKAKAVTIRQTSNHQVIAIVEFVSPGNKSSRHGLRAFVQKAAEVLRAGIHLLIVDLFPPGPRDPQGIHKAIWDELTDNDFSLPAGKPLTLAAYIGGPCPEAFVEPTAVGASLKDMPVFLKPDVYVPLPLEATYQAALEAVPAFWRNVLTRPPG